MNDDSQILRRFYPSQHPCPKCACTRYDVSVRSVSRQGHSFIYRKCDSCAYVFKVPLLAMEIENPDGTTHIRTA